MDQEAPAVAPPDSSELNRMKEECLEEHAPERSTVALVLSERPQPLSEEVSLTVSTGSQGTKPERPSIQLIYFGI